MFRISLIFFLLFLGLSAQATILDSLIVRLRIDEQKNILHITETFYLPASESVTNWHRVVYHNGVSGYPLLYQRLQNAKLTDINGKEFPMNVYRYGWERTHLDYQSNGLTGTCILSYEILNPFSGTENFYYEHPFYDFLLTTKKVYVDIELPSNIKLQESAWDITYYENNREGQFGYQNGQKTKPIAENLHRLSFNPDGFEILYDVVLKGNLKFSKPLSLSNPTTYQEEWQVQGGGLWWMVLVGLGLALSLRFVAPNTYPIAVRFYGIFLLVLVFVIGFPLYSFFWQSGEKGENFFTELVAQLGFLSFFGMMAYSIHKNLSKLNAQAYYGVMAFPFLLLLILFSASIYPAFYLLIPLAFAPMIFWFQQKNADYLGATYYRLVEQVETAGKMSFADLSKEANLSIERLIEIIKNIPHHPILIDHEAKEFLSAEAIVLQQKHQLCNNCGAATEVKNEDLVECSYCHTAYRDSQQKKSSQPVPEIVAVTSEIVRTVSYWFLSVCVLIVLAMLGDWITNGVTNLQEELIGVVVLLIIFGGLGMWLLEASESLKNGKSDSTKWLLIPLSIFITPAIILYRFFTSKRIHLHFDKNAVQAIESYLKQKGTASISDLASHLNIDKKEALELADYLCGNNLVHAVYDVQKNRIVHRSVWEKLKGVNSCNSCGGLMQIKGKEPSCMHCGKTGKSGDVKM